MGVLVAAAVALGGCDDSGGGEDPSSPVPDADIEMTTGRAPTPSAPA